MQTPLAVALTASLCTAQLVVDPNGGGTHTSLQAAIDAAAPGDLIDVRGGTYMEIVIDKPLRILAEPRAKVVQVEFPPLQVPQEVAVTVNVQSGDVVLSGFDVGIPGISFEWPTTPVQATLGSGSLLLVDCTVVSSTLGSRLVHHSLRGVPAITADGRLTLVRSTVSAANSGFGPEQGQDGPAGIRSTGDVLCVTSSVSGGNATGYQDPSALYTFPPCPSGRTWDSGSPGTTAGIGGPAVVARTVKVTSDSVLTGGQGGTTLLGTPNPAWLYFVCKEPDGAQFIGASWHGAVGLDLRFAAGGPTPTLLLGGCVSRSGPAVVALGFFAAAPTPFAGTPAYLDLTGPLITFQHPAPSPILLPPGYPRGLTIAAQCVDRFGIKTLPGVALTR